VSNTGVVVGETREGGFVWSEVTGMRPAPTAAGVVDRVYFVNKINAAGTIYIGEGERGADREQVVVRYTDGVPEVVISHRLSDGFFVTGMSDDGTVLVGMRELGPLNIPSVWVDGQGVFALSDYLALNGVVRPAGATLNRVTSISADGRSFGGQLRYQGAFPGFVATIPVPGVAVVFGIAIGGWRACRRRRTLPATSCGLSEGLS